MREIKCWVVRNVFNEPEQYFATYSAAKRAAKDNGPFGKDQDISNEVIKVWDSYEEFKDYLNAAEELRQKLQNLTFDQETIQILKDALNTIEKRRNEFSF